MLERDLQYVLDVGSLGDLHYVLDVGAPRHLQYVLDVGRMTESRLDDQSALWSLTLFDISS